MRGLLAFVVAVVGTILITAILAGMGVGEDNSGETVSASQWADDVCGAVAAWEGQLEVIGDELTLSNVGARRNDGGTGDHELQGTVYVRSVVDRVIQATEDTLQEGLRRAGSPDTSGGAEASLTLRTWAQETEDSLRSARQTLKETPDTTTAAFQGLGEAVSALEQSAVAGREAFREVAALDSELGDALADSDTCRDLTEREP